MVRWVQQEDSHGCGIAALAMLIGATYQDVKVDVLPAFDEHGISHFECDTYLAEHGYAVARKYLTITHARQERSVWPPEPFGDVHLCQVTVRGAIGTAHFVVLLGNGTVLDPLTPEPRRLSDYAYVHNVAAVVPIEAAQSQARQLELIA
jgi:hypothetical protein